MTTHEMEERARRLKAEWEELDRKAVELWNDGDESEEGIERYNLASIAANNALDKWTDAEADVFARWDEDALNPKGAK